MKKNWRRVLSLALCLVFTLAFAACGGTEASSVAPASEAAPAPEASSAPVSEAAPEGETYTFTDSTGREVELPTNIERVASGGPLANIMIYGVKPEVIVGWSSIPSDNAAKYIEQKYLDLPEYGKFYNNAEDFNREALMAWEPDVIMFVKGSIFETVADDASWVAIGAIQSDDYYEIPTEPYNWLGRPPGPNRMIGVRWLGNLLYPEVFDYDIEQEVKDFFSLFYRYDLSDEEVAELL